jgi:hypothetical protein
MPSCLNFRYRWYAQDRCSATRVMLPPLRAMWCQVKALECIPRLFTCRTDPATLRHLDGHRLGRLIGCLQQPIDILPLIVSSSAVQDSSRSPASTPSRRLAGPGFLAQNIEGIRCHVAMRILPCSHWRVSSAGSNSEVISRFRQGGQPGQASPGD